MNLYLISQSVNNDYDTYDSAIVAAESEEQAIRTHPNSGYYEFGQDGSLYFIYKDGPRKEEGPSSDWCEIKDVNAKLIGKAVEGTEAGVILASYNAG